MKSIFVTAGAFTVLAVGLCSVSYADYQFDDLQGPSGVSYQWMVLNNASNTFGDSHATAIDVSGDLITNNEGVLEVLSGKSESVITDRSLSTFFITAIDGYAEFDMNFRSPTLRFPTTPNLELSTITNENDVPYNDKKGPKGHPGGNYDESWRKYSFVLERNRATGRFDTVIQQFSFHQNPSNVPSQGIQKPMVIANVSSSGAQEEPLELRMILRDASSEGNIVAYDRDTWRLTDEKTIGGEQWVFVPVEDSNTDNVRINYFLTTEVVNHTSYRYVDYDGQNNRVYPNAWKFDLPRMQGNTYIEREFQLAPSSYIAPGLVTIYKRAYNVNESSKRPLRLGAIDTYETGLYDLILNHRIIFGKRLGETYKYAASEGRFNLFEITAYQPIPNDSLNFYDNVARITGSSRNISPATSNLTASSVSHKIDNIPSSAVQYFTVNQSIPSQLRSSTTEGILPLHITMNIPVTLVSDRTWWNNMANEWRQSGSIEEMFADNFEIYLMAETLGQPNPFNLSQELMRKGVYRDQIKVFFDEERGRTTQDNDRGLITVSFIVMLMNGTRDGLQPELSIVPDNSVLQDKDYIVIRDGNNDNSWKMTFFVAPTGSVVNPEPSGNNNSSSGGSGGGGGCNAGLGIMTAAMLIIVIKHKKEGR